MEKLQYETESEPRGASDRTSKSGGNLNFRLVQIRSYEAEA
jgi:hypothetical protein